MTVNDKAKHATGKADNNNPQQEQKGITRDELIEQLQAYIENFEKLPQHEKFSFALLCDVYYPMLIILNILMKGDK
jgi:hypothetical protein